MLLLALDTATSDVVVAVHDGRDVLAEMVVDDGPGGLPRHGEVLAPAVEAVLDRAGVSVADLTHVAVGVGPGPFTGLRVGIVTATVLARARGIPVAGVCTLDALARAAAAALGRGCAVATDARRREVYLARYDAHGNRTWGPRVLTPDDAVRLLGAEAGVVGPGAARYASVFAAAGLRVLPPSSVSAGQLASLVADRLRAGDPWPDGASAYEVGPAHDDGAATTVPSGLLAPAPLYLRRPDAVPPPGIPARVPAPGPGS